MLRALVGLLMLLFVPAAAQAQQRIGLVIGNQAYATEVGPLKNPHNDIRIVSKALTEIGFQMLAPVRDASRDQLLLAVHDFAERLRNAGADAIGFLYYAGHGVAVGSDNVVVPVNVKGTTRRDLEVYGVRLGEIITILNDSAPQAVHFVVFDACRNLAGGRGTRGFVPVVERPGMLIAFSTAPGTPASDEGKESGPYAAALASELVKPGRYHGDMFFEVRTKVASATREEQIPWTQDGLLRRVHFAKEAAAPTPGPDRIAEARDEAAWAMALEAGSAAAFRKYLELHPKGRRAREGKARLEQIETHERVLADQQRARQALEAEHKKRTEAEEARKRAATERQNEDALAWTRATAANRLEAYRAYLQGWPAGDHSEEAGRRIAELQRLAAAWSELTTSRDLPRLEAFAKDATGSEFGPPASIRLTELRALEATAWRAARERDSLQALEAFLVDWPHGFFAGHASDRIGALRAIRAEWDRLKLSHDENVLEAFIAQHGWSEFGAAATAKLVALRRDRAQPDSSDVRTLTAQELLGAIDGAEIRFVATGETFAFGTKAMPIYRPLLGRNFLKSMMKQELVLGEGAFKALAKSGSGSHAIEGLGGIVESRVDKTGSLFLMQMHGTERSSRDVDQFDRQFLTMQVVHDSFGHVCIATQWQSLRGTAAPAKRSERCLIDRK